jgi:hypothetical protein
VTVILSSPLGYQVFQRETRLRGSITIRGHAEAPAERVEARLAGQALTGPLAARWNKLSLDRRTGEFHAELDTAAGGFYRLEVRVRHRAHPVDTLIIPHVGVGEVFVVAGQSNSTNYGEVRQVPETGMVTTFSGEGWRLANEGFPIWESLKFTLRAEAFNAWNHPVLGTPGATTTTASSFGVIAATANNQRLMQLSGKLQF